MQNEDPRSKDLGDQKELTPRVRKLKIVEHQNNPCRHQIIGEIALFSVLRSSAVMIDLKKVHPVRGGANVTFPVALTLDLKLLFKAGVVNEQYQVWMNLRERLKQQSCLIQVRGVVLRANQHQIDHNLMFILGAGRMYPVIMALDCQGMRYLGEVMEVFLIVDFSTAVIFSCFCFNI